MAGEIKVLGFSQGTSVVTLPLSVFISSTGTLTFVDDAAYVTAKTAPAALGDFYGNSVSGKLRQYDGLSWKNLDNTLNAIVAASPTINDDSADFYSIGSKWLNTASGIWYTANSVGVGAAVWKEMIDSSTAQNISGIKTITNTTESNDKDTGCLVLEGGLGVEKNLNVGGTGNFTGAVTISNTTQASDKDTGCLILQGGLGVEKNAYVGGNVVITGDLTVNGTNTIFNTTVLDVEDANITLNKNGTQATAIASLAGFKVEMSDATHVQMKYLSTATSRFAIGDLGSEVEVVTISMIQTFTNKKFDDALYTKQIVTPANPAAGYNKLYFKADNSLYLLTSGGVETALGGGTLVDTTTSIVDSVDATIKILFDAAGTTGTTTTLLSSQTANRILTLPNATDTLVGKATTDSFTNKSLVDSSCSIVDAGDPTIKILFDAAGTTGTTTTLLGSQTSNVILTLPNATDTLVGKSTTDTLANKNLNDNTTYIVDTADPTKRIGFNSNGTPSTTTSLTTVQTANRIITYPDATTTLLGRDDTATITGKTFDDPIIDKHTTTPSNPPAGYCKIYPKANNNWYSLTSGGVESVFAGGVVAASAVTFAPYLTIGSTDTQAAINELKDEVDLKTNASILSASLAYKTGSAQTVTTIAQITFNTEETDVNGDFLSSAFTAPQTGYYLMSYCLQYQASSTPPTYFRSVILKNGTGYSSNNFAEWYLDVMTGSKVYTATGSTLMYLTSGETASVWAVAGSGNVGVSNTGSGNKLTYFSVYRF